MIACLVAKIWRLSLNIDTNGFHWYMLLAADNSEFRGVEKLIFRAMQL